MTPILHMRKLDKLGDLARLESVAKPGDKQREWGARVHARTYPDSLLLQQ